MAAIARFFEIPASHFRRHVWPALDMQDREQLKAGLLDGTLTY